MEGDNHQSKYERGRASFRNPHKKMFAKYSQSDVAWLQSHGKHASLSLHKVIVVMVVPLASTGQYSRQVARNYAPMQCRS